MQFEWDANKAAANYRKHKVSFDEALTVFRDPLAAIFDVLVCFTERAEDVIRIFSARRATKTEKAQYEENASF